MISKCYVKPPKKVFKQYNPNLKNGSMDPMENM